MKTADTGLAEFFAEADEVLQRVSAGLAELENQNHSQDLLDSIYRDVHTLKGSAQLFGLQAIAAVAHAMETCLDPVRRSERPPGAAMLDALYKCVSATEGLVQNAKSGANPETSFSGEAVLGPLFDATVRQFGADFNLSRDLLLTPEKLSTSGAPGPALTPPPPPPPVVPEAQAETLNKPETQTSTPAEPADSSIRVQVGLLDTLMNLVGEMVLVRNQVLQHSSRSEDLEFLNLSQRLDVVTSELQDQVMRTRMQPIGNVLSKFQRMIRDLARDLGKRIDLTLQGSETELDKTLLEAIKDPLTHIVRNACDHGIETTATRAKAGKPETGHVSIRAYHEGGQVIVEISDDGAGLNRQRIAAKAIERGILSKEATEKLSDREKLNLIFHPGLSTAEKVSSVSGRGVGMDVVKTNIERIGGSVELDSVEGRGSTIRLRIPLTLAIVPAMLIRSQGNEYAIPQIKLVELVRVEQEGSSYRGIRHVQGKPVYELRGKLLPLIELSRVLQPGDVPTARPPDTVNIVVLNAEGDYYGLVVDEVLDTVDIVVKPLSKFLKSLDVFSAATILGSGRVALILDPAGVSKAAHLTLEKKNAESDFQSVSQASKVASEQVEYLLFRLKDNKFALPLAMVSRLEDFACRSIEMSGEQPVIQYRNSILPLIDVASALGFGASSPGESAPTIVIQRRDRAFGFMVDEILDVCSEDSGIDDTVRDRFGVLGNLLLGDEVIVAIDAFGIIEKRMVAISGQSLEELREAEGASSFAKTRILYAEDVGFFRRQVSKLLSSRGYEVVAVEDGSAALEMLKSGRGKFDLILSDIEMPNMNGYQLARAVRTLSGAAHIPLIALTTKFSDRDIAEGKAAGFNCYLEKLNADKLIGSLESILRAKEERVA